MMMIRPKMANRMISLSLNSLKRVSIGMFKSIDKTGVRISIRWPKAGKTELQAYVNLQNYKYILIPETYMNDLCLGFVKRKVIENQEEQFSHSPWIRRFSS
jgi:hypothetical protein